jgi:acyl carrier protein
MDIKVLITEIASALEISESEITPESDSSMIEEWDSLGHISILARLDQTFDNITETLPDLASALSVSEMHKLLTDGGL